MHLVSGRCYFHYYLFSFTLLYFVYEHYIFLYLLRLRSTGGLYKAGRAEGSLVLWHSAENLLPDMPRRAAHAQTETSNYTQRPQGWSVLDSWMHEWCDGADEVHYLRKTAFCSMKLRKHLYTAVISIWNYRLLWLLIDNWYVHWLTR